VGSWGYSGLRRKGLEGERVHRIDIFMVLPYNGV
jgi:hypothetical protein